MLRGHLSTTPENERRNHSSSIRGGVRNTSSAKKTTRSRTMTRTTKSRSSTTTHTSSRSSKGSNNRPATPSSRTSAGAAGSILPDSSNHDDGGIHMLDDGTHSTTSSTPENNKVAITRSSMDTLPTIDEEFSLSARKSVPGLAESIDSKSTNSSGMHAGADDSNELSGEVHNAFISKLLHIYGDGSDGGTAGRDIYCHDAAEEDDLVSLLSISLNDFDFLREENNDDPSKARTKPKGGEEGGNSISNTSSSSRDRLFIEQVNIQALNKIKELKRKLRVQENSKSEILRQCLTLQTKLSNLQNQYSYQQNDDSTKRRNNHRSMPSSYHMTLLLKENKDLKQAGRELEARYLSDITEITNKMKEMDEELVARDEMIRILEEEVKSAGKASYAE